MFPCESLLKSRLKATVKYLEMRTLTYLLKENRNCSRIFLTNLYQKFVVALIKNTPLYFESQRDVCWVESSFVDLPTSGFWSSCVCIKFLNFPYLICILMEWHQNWKIFWRRNFSPHIVTNVTICMIYSAKISYLWMTLKLVWIMKTMKNLHDIMNTFMNKAIVNGSGCCLSFNK